jgi:hypothetical protein
MFMFGLDRSARVLLADGSFLEVCDLTPGTQVSTGRVARVVTMPLKESHFGDTYVCGVMSDHPVWSPERQWYRAFDWSSDFSRSLSPHRMGETDPISRGARGRR